MDISGGTFLHNQHLCLIIGGRLAGTIVRGEMGRDALTGVVCRSSLHTAGVGGAPLLAQLAVVYVQHVEPVAGVLGPAGPALRGLQTVLQDAIGVVSNAVLGAAADIPRLFPLPNDQVVAPRGIQPWEEHKLLPCSCGCPVHTVHVVTELPPLL